MTYETVMGESIAVLGSSDELGKWNKKAILYHLQWTDGHRWVSKEPLLTSSQHFRYKYVVCHDMKFKEYERGIDRIADLAIAEVSHDGTIYYNDVWQLYSLKFTVFSHEGDDDQMVMDFIHQSDGQTRTIRMNRSIRDDKWMFSKFGIPVVPWECNMKMDNLLNSSTGEFQHADHANFHYRYRKIRAGQVDEPERDPMRFLQLQGPGKYAGQLGESGITQQVNTSCVYIVNGMADKCDANFIGAFFFQELKDFGICIGNYPSEFSEVARLAKAGITGVLNL